MRRRQIVAALLLQFWAGIAGEASGYVSRFLELVGIFALNGALAERAGEFLHRFFGSFFLGLGWLRCSLRRGCATGFGASRRSGCACLCSRLRRCRRSGLLGLGNKNSRQRSLLVRGFIFLVIIFKLGIRNFW